MKKLIIVVSIVAVVVLGAAVALFATKGSSEETPQDVPEVSYQFDVSVDLTEFHGNRDPRMVHIATNGGSWDTWVGLVEVRDEASRNAALALVPAQDMRKALEERFAEIAGTIDFMVYILPEPQFSPNFVLFELKMLSPHSLEIRQTFIDAEEAGKFPIADYIPYLDTYERRLETRSVAEQAISALFQ